MFSKKMIYSFILSLFFINYSANAADLNEILKNVQGSMPKVLDNVMPQQTGPSVPFIKK